ncbi:uncharacterized protein EAE97_000073 [Botrytis byssoidea]|uniref:Uncharacterized protein n=1 Tax=Botrytis byssoidea TaxID=139641 RepID=A0A9P5IUN6_9HELO|nr:uncharacterized protein EAE97_000073 [Botrytis byssoidea]KAF7954814.1 hypothetical protein EAE97_000073 [Botrytis byssoidea]
MAPMDRQTRNIPRAMSFPRVSKEMIKNITRRDGSSTTIVLLDLCTASKLEDHFATIRSVTSPVAVLDPRSTTPQVNVGEATNLSSGAIAGIVLGSILGFLVLLVFGYMCCADRRSAGWAARYGADGDGDGGEMVYGDRRDSGGERGRVWKSGARGGGGGEWEMRCECDDGDGDEIRRPDKAVVRERRSGRERTYRRMRRERDKKWNDNYDYDRRNKSREWERGGNRRRRGRRRRRRRNTWVVVERRGIFSWAKPVRKSRGRSLRREMEMEMSGEWGVGSGECGEFGKPVRSWRGEGRNRRMGFSGRGGTCKDGGREGGDKRLRFDVRD